MLLMHIMMNLQQGHGHQQGQQVRQHQRHPKGKRVGQSDLNKTKSYLHSELPYLVKIFNRIKISRKGTYSLSTVTSLARGAKSTRGSRSTRRSRGASVTRLTTVSL